MIEGYNWSEETWVVQKDKTLREFVKTHSHSRPCKIKKTNQESFRADFKKGEKDNVYFYYWDNMGHMWLYRMPEDEWLDQWSRDDEFRKEQMADYDIFTGTDGYRSETPHTICGRCNRCKTCGDCTCNDKHSKERKMVQA